MFLTGEPHVQFYNFLVFLDGAAGRGVFRSNACFIAPQALMPKIADDRGCSRSRMLKIALRNWQCHRVHAEAGHWPENNGRRTRWYRIIEVMLRRLLPGKARSHVPCWQCTRRACPACALGLCHIGTVTISPHIPA